MARRADRLRLTGALFMLLCAVLFFCGLVVLVILSGRVPEPEAGGGVLDRVCSIAMVVALPVAFLVGRDAHSRSRGVRDALRVGYVRRFAGTAYGSDPTDDSFRRLVHAKLIEFGSIEHCELELFPLSNAVYAINNLPIKKYLRLRVGTAAAWPEDAADCPVPAHWHLADAPVEIRRRRQSPEETRELLLHARSVRRRLWFVPVASVVLCAPVGFLYEAGILPRSISILIFVAGATTLSGFVLFRGWRRASKDRADADLGWIIIVPPHHYTDEDGTQRRQNHPIEILRESGALWTINGIPAGWRREK